MTLCTTTGLKLVEGPLPGNYRIARSSYGALAPIRREAEADGSLDTPGWSRFDTVGHTLYSTDDRLTSFMELFAPYRTEINGAALCKRMRTRWRSPLSSSGPWSLPIGIKPAPCVPAGSPGHGATVARSTGPTIPPAGRSGLMHLTPLPQPGTV
jgi:hypothetical protein